MVASRRLPPSERDFALYRIMVVDGATTYEAADQFHISQTRVRQVQRKVVDWAAEILPPETQATTANLLKVTQIAASERLEHAYSEAIREWRLTSQPKFLNMVLRVIQSEVKLQLPARVGMLESLLDSFHEIDEREEAAAEHEAREARTSGESAKHAESASEETNVAAVDPAAAAAARAEAEADAAAEAAFMKEALAQGRAMLASFPPNGDCSSRATQRTGQAEPPQRSKHVTRERTGKLDRLLADDPFWKADQDERLRTLLRPADAADRS